MNALLNYFPDSKFSIVGFPCNQFGHQEPGDNGTEILNGLRFVRPGHGFQPNPNLHMMLKCDVNGVKEHPLYNYLKASCPQASTAQFQPRENFWDPIHFNDITWNFEKFIVSPDGVPLYRFQAMIEPFDLKEILTALMARVEQLTRQEKELQLLLNKLDNFILERLRETVN